VALRVIPSGIPSLEMLRHRHCDLVVSPRRGELEAVVAPAVASARAARNG